MDASELPQRREKKYSKKRKTPSKDLSKLRKEVEEKFAKGEKLTTEDLMILQSGN